MRHVIIMAGGSGTRFWPLSREQKPKQLLPLWDGRTLLEETVARMAKVVPLENLFIATSQKLKEDILLTVPEVPPENLVVEPCRRNTAPCVGLAATVIAKRDPEAVMGVFSADAYISRTEVFIEACRLGFERVESSDVIVTMGVQPTRPETGYGYIRTASREGELLPVEAFVEKPDLETAKQYLDSGNYLWNAGIFFFSQETLRREMTRQLPLLWERLGRIGQALDNGESERADQIFRELEPVSIDHGIMEHARRVEVIPANFEWNDVGHWASFSEVLPLDEAANVTVGDICLLDARDCVAINQGDREHLLAIVGVDGLVVVRTDDATLVLPKSRAQSVREVVAWLKDKGRDSLM